MPQPRTPATVLQVALAQPLDQLRVLIQLIECRLALELQLVAHSMQRVHVRTLLRALTDALGSRGGDAGACILRFLLRLPKRALQERHVSIASAHVQLALLLMLALLLKDGMLELQVLVRPRLQLRVESVVRWWRR